MALDCENNRRRTTSPPLGHHGVSLLSHVCCCTLNHVLLPSHCLQVCGLLASTSKHAQHGALSTHKHSLRILCQHLLHAGGMLHGVGLAALCAVCAGYKAALQPGEVEAPVVEKKVKK